MTPEFKRVTKVILIAPIALIILLSVIIIGAGLFMPTLGHSWRVVQAVDNYLGGDSKLALFLDNIFSHGDI